MVLSITTFNLATLAVMALVAECYYAGSAEGQFDSTSMHVTYSKKFTFTTISLKPFFN
jgi:hypothetical protein